MPRAAAPPGSRDGSPLPRRRIAILGGHEIIILSDRTAGRELSPIPALLACAGVHHHLIRTGLRQRCGLVIESGEPRETHHFATLFGYGASAVNPYLAFETLHAMCEEKMLEMEYPTAKKNFIKAINKGVLKVMSKMGISTLQSYKGAQQFECVGLSQAVVDKYFTWTATRLEGADINTWPARCRCATSGPIRPCTCRRTWSSTWAASTSGGAPASATS
jgi:glutamate synthase (ferredoxin)